jgi:cytochrome c oxidase subunit IV
MTHPTVPLRLYVGIFVTLILLTGLTVVIAFFDLGGGRLHAANAIAAITIAVTKALLVVLYFMHVRYSSRLTWIFVGAGVFWFAILIVLTLADYLSRGWFPIPGAWSS